MRTLLIGLLLVTATLVVTATPAAANCPQHVYHCADPIDPYLACATDDSTDGPTDVRSMGECLRDAKLGP